MSLLELNPKSLKLWMKDKNPQSSGLPWRPGLSRESLCPGSRDKQQLSTRSLTCGSRPRSLILPPPCLSRDLDPFDFTVPFWGILNYSGSQVQGSDPDFLLRRQKVHKKHRTGENCISQGAESLTTKLADLTPLCYQLLPAPRSDPVT